MIRMRPFHKMSYSELQNEYLRQLVMARAIAFNDEDVLDTTNKSQQKRTSKTLKILEQSGDICKGLKDFLFPKGEICRENLRELLVGPQNMPASLGGDGSYDLRQHFEKIIKKVGILEERPENKICKKIFRYDALNYKKKCQTESTAYWLQRQLSVKVCPYCNRMYTTTLFGEEKIRPDFDHFYPKSKYPYLAVSLFNLIPSCSMCNKKKGDKAEVIYENEENKNLSIIYPYDESFDEPHRCISFRVITGSKEALSGQSDDFTIELHPQKYSDQLEFNNTGRVITKTYVKTRFEHKIKSYLAGEEKDAAERESQFWDRAEASIELLLIEKFYNEHKDEVRALLRNHYQYNQDSIELIMKTIKVKHPDAVEQEMELFARDMFYFAFLQHEEWGKSPLNKLKSDILDQLDEIENTSIDS